MNWFFRRSTALTPQARKDASIARLKKAGVPYIEHLPMIEDAAEVRVRSAEAIASRAIACLVAIQAACDRQAEQYTPETAQWCQELLAQYGIDQLTPNEVRILGNEGGEQDVVNMVWKYEAYWVLLWALGVVKELDFPDHAIDCDFAIQAVSQHADFASFMGQVRLRDVPTLLDEADLIYRYHWACVDARLKQAPMPAGLNASVVMERHAALNWLIDSDGQDDWDNPDVST
ncbi:protein of unknown function [Pseudomonas flavescens]|uniref:DUF4272 domain-containing protein n=1 Tax=Phytopseudomonas flavescens TaxID=29435 RepID=A0A1G8EJN7_9GAMM|nr:DUF4272 domain-containing protein [Pseudomonas flavescens]SDH69939.1 protein of unknown function [Pseudomonas flavescens]